MQAAGRGHFHHLLWLQVIANRQASGPTDATGQVCYGETNCLLVGFENHSTAGNSDLMPVPKPVAGEGVGSLAREATAAALHAYDTPTTLSSQ